MCTCASCKETDSYANHYKGNGIYSGFADWPKGTPAGKRGSEAMYRAHVEHGQKGGIDRAIPASVFKQTGATFYGVPAGSTRAEQDRILRATFAGHFDDATGEFVRDVPARDIQKAPAVVKVAPARIVPAVQVAKVRTAPKTYAPIDGPSIAELLARAVSMRANAQEERAPA